MSASEPLNTQALEQQNALARRYTKLIGMMPASFSVSIKELIEDQTNGLTTLSKRSEFQVTRVMRGPTALAVLYWCTRTFCPDKLTASEQHGALDLARVYTPSTLASILAYTYLYKRIKRIVSTEEWQFISEPLQRQVEICGLLSWQLTSIGPTIGLLGGGLCQIAYACFSAQNKKEYAEYRRHLKMKKMYQDSAYEINVFGCTSIQIASQLLLEAGFGTSYAMDFQQGFRDPEAPQADAQPKGPFAPVRRWLEELSGRTLNQTQTQSGAAGGDILSSTTPDLIDKLKLVNRQGSIYHWLEKGSEDISPEKTPDLNLDGVIFK